MVRVASPPHSSDPSSEPTLNVGLPGAPGAGDDRAIVSPAVPQKAPAAGHFAPGELLAERFRIVRFLGHGGMGDVYEAEDEEVRGRVALKTVRAEIARRPGALERFAREIHLARKVTHPNVCRIFDISHHGHGESRVTFLTMELLAGETLEARLQRGGPMRESEALPVVRQMVEGLAAAHRAGVVHRDFKPANVMLVPEEEPGKEGGVRPVVTDFGLAHGAGAEAAGDGLTVYGDILGTPSYMAPEQVTGGEVTPVTDVYAFGVVLYEMVTGCVPFKGTTALSTAVKRLKEPPPPPRLRAPDLDPAWEAAILRCLAVEPQDRFGSVREAVAALEPPAIVPVPARRGWSRWLIAGAALVLAVVALLIGLRLRRPVDPNAGDLPAEISSGSLPANPGAKDLYQRGRDALAHYNAAQARDLLTQAVAAEPGFPLAHSALAETWNRLGYVRKAADEAKLAFAALPARLSPAERSLVQARYSETVGNWDQAVGIYRSLRASFPRNLEYGLGLARALTQAGRAKEALQVVTEMKRTADDARLDLAEAATALSLSQLGPARAAAVRARIKAEKEGSRSLMAQALLYEGNVSRSQQDYPAALAAFDKANDIFTDTGDVPGLAQVAKSRAAALYHQGNLKAAQEGFNDALSLYRRVQDRRGEATELNDLASILGTQGHFAEAARQYETAARVLRETGDRDGEARALGNLGYALGMGGRLAEGVPRIQAALKIFEETGNQQEQVTFLGNLASLYQNRGDLVPARRALEQALDLADQIGNRALSADSSQTLGAVLAAQGDLDGAFQKYQSAMEVRSQLKDPKLAESQCSVAEIFLEQELPRQALPYADKAARETQALQDEDGEAAAGALLARIELALNDPRQARAAIERAEKLAAKSEDPSLQGAVALAAGRVLAAEGKTAEAVRRLEAAIASQRKAGQVSLELDLRLALGEIQASHGDHPKGREILQAVQKEARQHGMGLIAGKAAKALGGSG
jgi:tetratricopeptide (TPR) repeat protein